MRTITELYQDISAKFKAFRITDAGSLIDQFGDFWGLNKSQHTGYVAACLDTMGNFFAKAQFKVYKNVKGKPVVQPDHPFIKLLNKPNSFQTSWDQRYFIGVYFGVFGNFYLLKGRGSASGKVRNLIMLDPTRMEPIQEEKWIDYYEYNKGTEKVRLETEDVIHIRRPTSDSVIVGKPIVEAIADILDVDALQMGYMKKFYKEGGFLGNTFSTTQNMSPATFKRAKQELIEKYSGSENAFKVALFESGLQPIKSAYSIREMELGPQRRLTLEEVMTAFRIPQILLGGSNETYNFGTAKSAEYAYTSTLVDPYLTNVDEVFTRHVKNDYGEEFFVAHDALSTKDVEENLKYYKDMTSVGAFTINEVRERERLPALNFALADVPLLNVGGAAIRIDNGEQLGAQPNNVLPKPKSKGAVEDLHWKQFNRWVNRDFKWFKRRVSEAFDAQRERVLKLLEGKNLALVETFYEMEEEYVIILQMIENGWLRFQDRGASFSGASGIRDNGRKDQFLNYSRSINDTTKKRIVKRVQGGEDIRSVINSLYNDFDQTRVPGIAETTAVSGFNAGLWLGYRSQGYKKKMWVSQRDGDVRHSHFVADSQVVGIDENFIVGIDQLMYPGDPIASAEEIINCRCTLLGIKGEDNG